MDWDTGCGDPRLGDVTLEGGSSRWYVVVGVEEHRDSPDVWKLILERISPDDATERLLPDSARFWPHVRYRRTPS